MQETTLRFHTYQARAEEHTQRDEDVIAAENAAHPDRWIDPEAHKELGAGLREIEAYQELFGAASRISGRKRASVPASRQCFPSATRSRCGTRISTSFWTPRA